MNGCKDQKRILVIPMLHVGEKRMMYGYIDREVQAYRSKAYFQGKKLRSRFK